MVEDFYNKLSNILDSIEEKFGSVDFFGAFKMDEFTEKWSLLLGANWVEEKKRDAFSLIVKELQEKLEEDERNSIARLGIFDSKEHLIKLMLKEFNSKDVVFDDKRINGNIIHEGYIIKSITDS